MSNAGVVRICSQALLMLEQGTITSLDEETDSAQRCKIFYEDCRDWVLRRHPWNCALTRVELARLATGPAFGYDHQYVLPGDFLRAYQVTDSSGEDIDDYRIETVSIAGQHYRVLVTDMEPPVRLRYVTRVEDVTLLDPLVRSVIAAWLAYQLALKSNSARRKEAMLQTYEWQLREAVGADAAEVPVEIIDEDPWGACRS